VLDIISTLILSPDALRKAYTQRRPRMLSAACVGNPSQDIQCVGVLLLNTKDVSKTLNRVL
jgi:hypothetical protein